MKTTALFLTLLSLIAGGCKQKSNQFPSKIWVDYKSDTYGIMLGDHKRGSQTVIDWQYDPNSEPDSVFMSLGEPLIHYNRMEWLPALRIKTDNGMIVSFSCSISFFLEEKEDSVEDFLNIIGRDIKQLQIDSIRQHIILDGIAVIQSENHMATYKLIKRNECGSVYDQFTYMIKKL